MTGLPMITHAFIQEQGQGRVWRESGLLQEELTRRGIPVTLFTSKRILRRQLPLTRQTLVAGDVPVIRAAFQQLKIEPPAQDDYPECLRPWLHRRVWRSTLQTVFNDIAGDGTIVFAKPADRAKNFTGRVFDCVSDFSLIGSVSRRQEVWCSEVVEWLSEYRVYVIHGRIAGADLYAGSADYPLDLTEVQRAVDTWHAAGTLPAGCGIDFGVLSTGQTALIEANDGTSLGGYKISAAIYTDLVVARWEELTATADAQTTHVT